jgi:Fe2+ or Zn2+ uptake regulation protein
MYPEHSIETLRIAGHRLTQQRRLVLEIIQHSQGHLEADEIYRRLKDQHAHISLATVYRTLALLKEVGLVQEHSLGQSHGHFEAAPASPHYHFTCRGCGKVIEFAAPQVMALARHFQKREGVRVTDVHLFFDGFCADCLQTQSAQTGRNNP